MENNILKFKTSINCGGCIDKVTPYLNSVKGITKWDVDTADKNKVLSVISDEVVESDIVNAFQQAGFKIEKIN
ncbi:MAG: cation transporter [Dysgonomonas mossii]|uniref:heavy-metal-associated domain-containing protein n=1 Tax=Dysgonomonas mossii TaxID=163665 RepID=UPI001D42A6DA|nr:cation transporter [Dysgonomonas mossii]MBS5797011.1 cation transporter [Dysgonomonas mossii]MBS7111848.1 cation transporter [Dysgonomonas mossii]